jgi:hypothetical protein
MNGKQINSIKERLGIGYVMRVVYGTYCNIRYPAYNLFRALALKSGLPGAKEFYFTTDGQRVKLVPYGQHLDQHGSDIADMRSLRKDLEAAGGKIEWITRNRLLEGKYLSEFVKEGPVRIHFLPAAQCLAAGGGRNRLMTLMRLGYGMMNIRSMCMEILSLTIRANLSGMISRQAQPNRDGLTKQRAGKMLTGRD